MLVSSCIYCFSLTIIPFIAYLGQYDDHALCLPPKTGTGTGRCALKTSQDRIADGDSKKSKGRGEKDGGRKQREKTSKCKAAFQK